MARRKTITKDQILNAAYALVATEGFDKFTARNVAQKMKCSTQPIYLEFENMDDLRIQVLDRIKKHLVEDVFSKEITGNLLNDLVLSYVKFASSERVLYRALYVEEHLEAEDLNKFNHDSFMNIMEKDPEFHKLSQVQKENWFISSWIVATGLATLNASGMYRPSDERIIELMDETKKTAFSYEGKIETK